MLEKNNYSTTNKRHVFVDNYFYIHIFYLLYFNINDMLSLDSKYFFLF